MSRRVDRIDVRNADASFFPSNTFEIGPNTTFFTFLWIQREYLGSNGLLQFHLKDHCLYLPLGIVSI